MIKRNELMTMTAALTVLLLLVTAQFSAAATLTVTNVNDEGAGSLRQVLADAVDGDTIDFSVSGTIMLTSGQQLTVDKSVSITVPSDQDLTVDGLDKTRVFYIEKGKTVTISGLTISHGYALNNAGGGVYNAGTLTLNDSTLSDNSAMLGGGGVFTEGDLTITGSTLSGNTTGVTEDDYHGGGAVAFVFSNETYGVSVHPKLTVDSSLLTGNVAPSGGGILISVDAGTGVDQEAWATVTVKNSTLSDNVATAGYMSLGGAMTISVGGDTIVSSAEVTVENCTLSNNSATSDYYAMGGGIAILAPSVPFYGILFLKNSTFSGNSAFATNEGDGVGFGGAMYLYGGTYEGNENTYYSCQVFLDNCTLNGNHDTYGVSGILNDGGKVELKNTILANDPSGANLDNEGLFGSGGGIIISHGYNLSSDNDADFLTEDSDQINTDPMLSPLADNGGPTLTHALLAGSPAIDAGNPNSIEVTNWIPSTVITSDQRGVARPQGENNDIGAFELEYSESEYEWSGVLPPVNPDGTSVFKARSTIPVKFMLTGLSAGITDLEATLSYIQIGSGSPGAVNESVSTSAATTGNAFRYDPASDAYIFNWSTKGMTQGAYRLYIDLGDSVERFVDVGLK